MERHGWRRVGARSTLIGDLREVHDLEELEDANTVPSAFAAAYEDPGFVQAAVQLATIADRKVLSLVTETPYSPSGNRLPTARASHICRAAALPSASAW